MQVLSHIAAGAVSLADPRKSPCNSHPYQTGFQITLVCVTQVRILACKFTLFLMSCIVYTQKYIVQEICNTYVVSIGASIEQVKPSYLLS